MPPLRYLCAASPSDPRAKRPFLPRQRLWGRTLGAILFHEIKKIFGFLSVGRNTSSVPELFVCQKT